MQRMNAIDEDWREKRSLGPIYRTLKVTDAGLMLGRETILVRAAHGAADAAGVSIATRLASSHSSARRERFGRKGRVVTSG
jgi:hypothetical protein